MEGQGRQCKCWRQPSDRTLLALLLAWTVVCLGLIGLALWRVFG